MENKKTKEWNARLCAVLRKWEVIEVSLQILSRINKIVNLLPKCK